MNKQSAIDRYTSNPGPYIKLASPTAQQVWLWTLHELRFQNVRAHRPAMGIATYRLKQLPASFGGIFELDDTITRLGICYHNVDNY